MHEIYKTVHQNTQHIAFKKSRKNFWLGLVATSLGFGISIPVLNNLYTQYKVKKELAAWNQRKANQSQMNYPGKAF